jgi:predicted DNA-binding mobile mystery protein A
VYEIRNALGMSAAQLGARLGVRQSSIAKVERTEQAETVSLATLRRIANAMDCELVYALLPRQSLETTLEQQALRQAARFVGRVEHSMELEDQASNRSSNAKIQNLADEMVRTNSPEIWQES